MPTRDLANKPQTNETGNMSIISRLLIIMVAIMVPAVSYSQVETLSRADSQLKTNLLKRSKFTKSSLLDPSKFSMSHQYSMLFSAGNFGQGATGLYMNSISYRVTPSMLLRVHLGLEHSLFSSGSSQYRNGKPDNSRIVPGFDFTFRPSDDTVFHVSYGTASMRSRYPESRFLINDPGRFEETFMTSPFFSDSPDRDFMLDR
jgi:hypothetical protein